MERHLRDEVRRAFDRRIGPPPPGARQRVLAAVAADESTTPHWAWRGLAALAVLMLGATVVVTLLTAREAQQRAVVPAQPAPAPAPRLGAAVAYDPVHRQLVVFGGNTQTPNGLLQDTWLWDGGRWSQAKLALSPPARADATAVFDPKLGVVLFGGRGVRGVLTDTWAWNGSTWRQLPAGEGPRSDLGVALAYDPASSSIIAQDYVPPGTGETWRLRNQTWEKAGDAPALGQTFVASDGRGLILVGMPFSMEQGQYRSQTWSWDGARWTQLHPAVDLPLGSAVGAYDIASRNLVVLTGGETWAWDGATWARLHPAHQPDVDYGAAAGLDGRGRLLVFGGQVAGTASNELWSWDGSDWRLLTGTTSTPPQSRARVPRPVPTGADAVAGLVAATTTGVDPRLVPAYVPAGMTAEVSAAPGLMSIQYTDDTHQRSFFIGVVVANPPPIGPNGRQSVITFHGRRASYWIYDTTAPLSLRNLTWTEPGTWDDPASSPSRHPSVHYFASSSGITEAEFFRVLNSLQKV